jgi:hypothetical protein
MVSEMEEVMMRVTTNAAREITGITEIGRSLTSSGTPGPGHALSRPSRRRRTTRMKGVTGKVVIFDHSPY